MELYMFNNRLKQPWNNRILIR